MPSMCRWHRWHRSIDRWFFIESGRFGSTSIEAIDGWDGCRWVVGGGATGDGTRARARATMEAMEADDVERGDGDGESAFDALSDGREWSLGFLERARDETTTRRERFPSKAGGAPAWLDPVRVPYDEELRAEDGETLDFLLQVYAPVDEEPTAFHRTVYVFASSSGGETHGPRGCRAFRGQLPRENAYYAWDPLPEGMLGRELSREEADARRARCDRWDVSARECEGGDASADEDVSRVRVGGRDGGARRDGGVRGDEIREWDGRGGHDGGRRRGD